MTDLPDLAPGQLAFHDDDVPAFPAGVYQITAHQDLSAATDGYFTKPAVQDFEVRAPQFALDPGETASLYPPADTAGDYSEVLAHIVLTEPTLPWERDIPGTDMRTPWFALLVLTDAEIVSTTVTTPAALLRPDPNVIKPDLDPTALPAAIAASATTALVLSADVFQAVIPTAAELPYLAHVRSANLSGQDGGSTEVGTFAVVVASRFPDSTAAPGTSGTRNRVHLVSLEGHGALLTGHPDFGHKLSGGPRDVALVSLASWSFVSAKAAGGTFAALMGDLVDSAHGDPRALLLRAPVPKLPAPRTPAQQEAQDRIAAGYVPLDYATATGEQTFAWYRGPWTPEVAQPLPAKPEPGRYTSADQATVFIEQNGVFDLSYAAAWTLGRTAGLADRAFATALYQFRRRVHQLVDLALSRIAALGDTLSGPATLVTANPVTRRFGNLVAAGLGDTVHTAVLALDAATGANAPTVAPPPPAPGLSPRSQVTAFLGTPAGLALIAQAGTDAADGSLAPVGTRVAALARMEGVPFTHLVPHPSMLPVESIRFFHVDPGWTGALIDGALSVAVESSRDLYVLSVFDAVLDKTVADAQKEGTPVAGLLLRSSVVSGWPGLTVTAKAGSAPVGVPVVKRLSADVLLCLFAAVPDTVWLTEPAHGLVFGAQDGFVLELRSLTPPVGVPAARPRFPETGDLTQYLRPAPDGAPARVLSITALVAALKTRLGVTRLGAADFAVLLVRAPERLVFAPHKTLSLERES
ncbi:hypothetical protein [Catenulispora subtropica]|uniref:Baseplate protein J-like domain-containing protein n=1 Tax=Catenulispora subtropica TaxID=450798 RepID=A0ABP5C3E9_9ACTN